MTTIRPAQLDDLLTSSADDPPVVLDIRPAATFEAGAIDGSHNLPVYDDLRDGDDSALRDRLDEVPSGRDVVVVCKMGVVATRATAILNDEGYSASTLRGGMSGWRGYQANSATYKLRSLIWKLRS